MKKIILCICTYNRNEKLIKCLQSIKRLRLARKFKLEILVLDNSINSISKSVIKTFQKSFSNKIFFKSEKKRGIVNARNACLNFLKKKKPSYIGFIDDDCTLSQYWLINAFKIMRKFNADIVTGPQLYNKKFINDKKLNFTEFFEKKYKKGNARVKWAATNNVLFKFNTIEKSNLKFDMNLNKFGMGEDQLFFSQLSKLGKRIYWSNKMQVTEAVHNHRQNVQWLSQRSFRLGVLGNYIDRKIYGNSLGFLINYLKTIYFLFKFILILLSPFKKNYLVYLNNYFFRALGKFLGPFIFSKVGFSKK